MHCIWTGGILLGHCPIEPSNSHIDLNCSYAFLTKIQIENYNVLGKDTRLRVQFDTSHAARSFRQFLRTMTGNQIFSEFLSLYGKIFNKCFPPLL